MPKTLMLTAVLLLSAAWLQAQQYPQTGSSPSSSSPSSSSQSDPMSKGSSDTGGQTVEGCLQGSNGNFTLTDNSGTTYTLAGDTSKLTEHVGHEVRIKGTASGAAAGSSGAGAGSSSGASAGAGAPGGGQTLTVESVKHVAKTCKSAGGK
jgi:Protein of unknown function (DUF5818)